MKELQVWKQAEFVNAELKIVLKKLQFEIEKNLLPKQLPYISN